MSCTACRGLGPALSAFGYEWGFQHGSLLAYEIELERERARRSHCSCHEQVPVREFWSITIYSLETASFFLHSTHLTLGSLDKELKKNADGSVDIYIGPKAPAGQESNWLYTEPGKKWFPWFRLYGLEKPIFDKVWKLPDFEKVN